MEAKSRATPVARLKRRILQKRRCVSPIRKPESEGDVRYSRSSSKGQTEITQLQFPSETPSGNRPGTPKLVTASSNSSSVSTQPVEIKQKINDGSRPTSKMSQPHQRSGPQSYLERWKAAQLNPRPCTALGLLSQLDSEAAGEKAKGTFESKCQVDFPQVVNRHCRRIRPVQTIGHATTERSMMVSPTLQPDLRNANPSSYETPTGTSLIKPRPVTSLGILTLRDGNVTPKKSIQFHVEEPVKQSGSGSTLLQLRPKTPAALIDRVRTPLAFGEKTPDKAQRTELSSKSQTSLNLFQLGPSGTTHKTLGAGKPVVLPKPVFSTERDNPVQQRPSSKLSQPRRFVIARSGDVTTRTIPKEADSSLNKNVIQVARDSAMEDTRTDKPDMLFLFRKKVANIVPRAVKLPGSVTSQPRQLSENSRNDSATPKTAKDNTRFQAVRRRTPFLKEGSSGYPPMWQEEVRGMDNCDIEDSDTSAPHNRRGNATTKVILTPATTLIQNTDNDCDKEDRILSWLGECEESTLSTYLPTLASDSNGTHS